MNPTTTLKDIATNHPATTSVFLRHRLDFCCGGRQTLAQACTNAGLDVKAILAELEQVAAPAQVKQTDWSRRSQQELADHIEERYHAGLRRDLPPLIDAARKIERVHAGKPGVPVGLEELLAELYAEMESHMAKEERILFPLIRRGARGPQVYMPVRMMEREHDGHGAQLDQIRALTNHLRAPEGACATWLGLYRGLEALEADLIQHIHLENNLLFARATGEAGDAGDW